MTTNEDKALDRLRKLHALLGSENAGESENARRLIVEWLKKHRKTWNDLPDLLQKGASVQFDDPAGPPAEADSAFGNIPCIDLVHDQLGRYLDMKPHELIAVTLWILHTHVFDKFMHTPRLMFVSPVENSGKSTALDIIEQLIVPSQKAASITAAALYHILDSRRCPMLLDEADNADMSFDERMRRVLNGGWSHSGGTQTLMQNGAPRNFNLYAPVALASIGGLPRPLMSRSIIIRMERTARDDLKRFDNNDLEDLQTVYALIRRWASNHADLDPNPDMPPELRNRARDNWRPLVAIADSFGWGKSAREAAVEMSKEDHYENPAILLLRDIRQVFDAKPGATRLASEQLVTGLHELDDSWLEWRGQNGQQTPKKLSTAACARILKEFGIRPEKMRQGQTFWRGYFRSQFDDAWRQYCSETATPPRDRKLRRLTG